MTTSANASTIAELRARRAELVSLMVPLHDELMLLGLNVFGTGIIWSSNDDLWLFISDRTRGRLFDVGIEAAAPDVITISTSNTAESEISVPRMSFAADVVAAVLPVLVTR